MKKKNNILDNWEVELREKYIAWLGPNNVIDFIHSLLAAQEKKHEEEIELIIDMMENGELKIKKIRLDTKGKQLRYLSKINK